MCGSVRVGRCSAGSSNLQRCNVFARCNELEKMQLSMNLMRWRSVKTSKIVHRSKMPRGVKVMNTRWVHKSKTEANGEIRFRSWKVARGFADTKSYKLSEFMPQWLFYPM